MMLTLILASKDFSSYDLRIKIIEKNKSALFFVPKEISRPSMAGTTGADFSHLAKEITKIDCPNAKLKSIS